MQKWTSATSRSRHERVASVRGCLAPNAVRGWLQVPVSPTELGLNVFRMETFQHVDMVLCGCALALARETLYGLRSMLRVADFLVRRPAASPSRATRGKGIRERRPNKIVSPSAVDLQDSSKDGGGGRISCVRRGVQLFSSSSYRPDAFVQVDYSDTWRTI